MICQNCKKKMATARVTCYSAQGYPYSFALCDECKRSLAVGECTQGKCKRCGATLSELITGRAEFCPECYSSFGEALLEHIKRLHGSDLHRGRRPRSRISSPNEESKATIRDKLDELKEKLSFAISDERYEEAAVIRDEINKLQGVMENGQ